MHVAVSKDIKVTLGVPQGSHLGSLCFIWFVNRTSDIFDYVLVLFYADDMKLFLPVSRFQDCLKIQSDLNKLLEWCDRNSLLNPFYDVRVDRVERVQIRFIRYVLRGLGWTMDRHA
jgi:hypothetical protein